MNGEGKDGDVRTHSLTDSENLAVRSFTREKPANGVEPISGRDCRKGDAWPPLCSRVHPLDRPIGYARCSMDMVQ